MTVARKDRGPSDTKIFPRNLTAHADYAVRGNPSTSRPESGVGNCYPGLEFDQRNLDKSFFPGLLFEFHRDDGCLLRSITPGSPPAAAGLTQRDLDAGLYLWAVLGSTARPALLDAMPLQAFDGLGGLDVWRRVRDLGPGPLAILIGPAPGRGLQIPSQAIDALRTQRASSNARLERPAEALLWAVLVSDRSRILDPDGVIDTDVFGPGDLTRSLCVPWQYDFRDCGCFYWASNKPDIVASSDGASPYLNFQRRDRAASVPDVAPKDRASWLRRRREDELDYAELIRGSWATLPVVLNDRESERFTVAPGPSPRPPMTPPQVAAELQYLATVEHALSVQYLYAHYSVNARYVAAEALLEDLSMDAFDQPRFRLPAMSGWERRIFLAAHDVLRTGVDEMRHLRWVNEALGLLGAPASVGRATVIGRDLKRPFALVPLTPEQLDWFIEVEQPSQAVDEGIDGMYVWLLRSIESQAAQFPESERLTQLIKLIIDEGGGHYGRFLSIKRELAGMRADEYLREQKPPTPERLMALDLSDKNYETALAHLLFSFRQGDRAGGQFLNQARRAMYNLHEVNHYLAAGGVMPRFALPDPFPTPPALGLRATRAQVNAAAAFLVDLERSVESALSALEGAGGQTERELVGRQRERNEALFQGTLSLIGGMEST
jgi:hypothetical protein